MRGWRALAFSQPLLKHHKSFMPKRACHHTMKQREYLHHVYTINEKAQVALARRTAIASTYSLMKYLQKCPVPSHTQDAFLHFMRWRQRPGASRELCFDACCAQGWSTIRLARRFPNCDFVGIDKSLVRLCQNSAFRHASLAADLGNAFLLRADMVHFWRLCWEHGIFPQSQYLFYPNPYPKQGHLKRRWHGHPIFPVIVAMGGRIEVRASWEGYLHEFRAAYISSFETFVDDADQALLQPQQKLRIGAVESLDLVEGNDAECAGAENMPITNFEAKYVRLGLPVYRLLIESESG